MAPFGINLGNHNRNGIPFITIKNNPFQNPKQPEHVPTKPKHSKKQLQNNRKPFNTAEMGGGPPIG